MNLIRRIALLLALSWLDRRTSNGDVFVFRGDETLSAWSVRVTVEIEPEVRVPVDNEVATYAT